jgi:hypothetical protein
MFFFYLLKETSKILFYWEEIFEDIMQINLSELKSREMYKSKCSQNSKMEMNKQ